MPKVKPQFQCQHILDSGVRCGSPRMKRKEFCYYHLRTHESFVLPGHEFYEPPVLDNFHSISLAMRHVHAAHSKRLITAIEARTMLYNLQLAQQNLRFIQKTTPIHPNPENVETTYTPAMRNLLWLEDELPDPVNPNVPCPHCGQHYDAKRHYSLETQECGADIPVRAVQPTTAADVSTTEPSLCHVEADPERSEGEAEVPLLDLDCSPAGGDEHEPILPTRLPPHPLQNASGLRPWRAPCDENTDPYAWVPITPEELERIDAAGLPRDEDKYKTREQAYNIHRLRISRHLRDHSRNPTTRQLIAAVAGAYVEELQIEKDIQLSKRMAEEYSKKNRQPQEELA